MKQTLFSLVLLAVVIACNNTKRQTGTAMPEYTDAFKEAATSPHRSHDDLYKDFNFSSEAQWDSLTGKDSAAAFTSKPAARYERHHNYKTFGWHLYSKGAAYTNYNFSLLWGISYFSYTVNPETGGYTSVHEWKTTALVDSAKAHNCKVFLSVSNFGARENATFLESKKARETLADSLSALLKLRAADGINIDFEGVASESSAAFTDFIVSLSEKLKQINPDYSVSLALYAVDYNKVFDIKTIDPHIDFYTLMSYDYYGGFSDYAGPVAPLNSSALWGANSVATSVDYYLNEGVRPDKLIVGIPYYGAEWETSNAVLPGKAEKFYANPAYDRIRDHYMDLLGVTVRSDEQSSSNYFTVKNEDGTLRQMWFNDSLSLAGRYDWVKDKKLAGVGIWALGYDQGTTGLWELLAAKFGQEK